MAQAENTPGAITPATARVGLIGVGNMGAPMGSNLLKAGWDVRVYDADSAKSTAFASTHGGRSAASLEELARSCDVVITMLPDGHIVRKVVLGGGDCLGKGLARGAVVIDMSSSAPVGTRELGKELAGQGVALLDAPVSGGVKGAIAGTLAIMTGGDAQLAQRCDLLLAAMGRRFYVGALGSGHAAKVLNNYVSAAGLAAAGEAVIIAQRFGIDPQTIINVINASSGRNNSTENKFTQFILSGKFNSGFSLGLMAKDIALAMDVAQACDVEADLGRATLQLWKDAEAGIGGQADHTEVVRHLERAKK
jgi:3-hydroxyisobutyrate dehydrogenase